MSPSLSPVAAAATTPDASVASIGTPTLWAVTVGLVLALVVLDFLLTRRPHEVSLREALGWSAFYVALPLAFGGWVWARHGGDRGVEYLTGYLVEKSLSVDNLFIFMLLLAGFAVPKELQQRVLLYGVVGALALRGVFIALGAAALGAFDWVFLVFGIVLVVTGVKILRDAVRGHGQVVDVSRMRVVRLARRLLPVTEEYDGPRLTTRSPGRPRALTPLALVVLAVLATYILFAIDSVPAVYGITGDPFLVFATNAFALLGLRALYFVLESALSKLVHLGYGLAAILGFIGVKLALHWGHLRWDAVPEIPTLASRGVVVGNLAVTVATSLSSTRRTAAAAPGAREAVGASSSPGTGAREEAPRT